MIPTFDIEVVNWVEPVAVGFFDGNEYHEFLKIADDHNPVIDFLEFLGDHCRGVKLFAHNAASFDNKFILNGLHHLDQRVRFEGGMSRIIWVEKKIAFEDSYVLLGRNLAAVCEAFDVPRKLEWDHVGTEDNIWSLKDRFDSFRAYLKRDCTSLSQAVENYSLLLLDYFGITPASTMSLTAVRAFDRRFHPVRDIASNEQF